MSSHTSINHIQHFGGSDDYEKKYLYTDGVNDASKDFLLFLYSLHMHYYQLVPHDALYNTPLYGLRRRFCSLYRQESLATGKHKSQSHFDSRHIQVVDDSDVCLFCVDMRGRMLMDTL